MTEENRWGNKEKAIELRNDEKLIDAGEQFTLTAYQYLGQSSFSPPYGHTAWGLYALLMAGTCYIIGGEESRCKNRCRQGILIAEDIKHRVLAEPVPENIYDHARRGAWDEYIGDFRVLGQLEEADEAYDAAVEIYLDAGDPDTGFSEQEHMRLRQYFTEVAGATGYNSGELNRLRTSISFSAWIAYKREYFPDILDRLSKSEKWESPC